VAKIIIITSIRGRCGAWPCGSALLADMKKKAAASPESAPNARLKILL
jgi:hypothetical protein